MIMRAVYFFVLLLVHTALLHSAEAVPADSSYQLWGSSTSRQQDTTRSPRKSKKKWTSMLSVDPSKILSTLVNRGGLLIPKSIEKDIDVLKKVLHVEEAELNLIEKKLILYNVTIALKGRKNAVRVGRVFVHWDSYTKPCIDIEVDEVDVLVEFENLSLSRDNWRELKQNGFPPEFAVVETAEASSSGKESSVTSFVRFSSIDLSGNATVQVASRPLKKDIGVFTLDMDVTDGINAKIREISKLNKASTGRTGCTATELADLLQSYFSQQIRTFLSGNLRGLASDPGSAVRVADRILTKTSDTILGYASDAGRKTSDDIQDAIANRLSRWGLSADQINTWKDTAKNVNTELLTERLKTYGKRDEKVEGKEETVESDTTSPDL
jgi:hypothetical protein